MSYQFQPIGEVDRLDEVPETANAIVEVDGEIKRVPGAALGGNGGGGDANGDSGISIVQISITDTVTEGEFSSVEMTYDDAKSIVTGGGILIAKIEVMQELTGAQNYYTGFVFWANDYLGISCGNGVNYKWYSSGNVRSES